MNHYCPEKELREVIEEWREEQLEAEPSQGQEVDLNLIYVDPFLRFNGKGDSAFKFLPFLCPNIVKRFAEALNSVQPREPNTKLICGGQLKEFAETWTLLFPDSLISKWIQEGAPIFIKGRPTSRSYLRGKEYNVSPEEEQWIDQEIDRLTQLHVLEAVREGELFSRFPAPLFTVEKKSKPNQGRRFRLITDFTELNDWTEFPKVRNEDLRVLMFLIQPGDTMMIVDWTEGYFQIPVRRPDQDCLQLSHHGRNLRITAIPFGLSSAPLIFTKVARQVLHLFRALGLRCSAYLDDFSFYLPRVIISHPVWKEIECMFGALGISINDKKDLGSDMELIGHRIIIREDAVWLTATDEKWLRLRKEVRNLINRNLISRQMIAGLVGRTLFLRRTFPAMSFFLYPVARWFPHGAVHYSSWKDMVVAPASITEVLHWIRKFTETSPPRVFLRPQLPKWRLLTDASGSHVGVVLQDQARNIIQTDNWEEEFSQEEGYSNFFELKAILNALKLHTNRFRGQVIRVQSDNASACFILKKLTTRSVRLRAILGMIIDWMVENRVTLLSAHIPGCLHTLPDFLSRPELWTNEFNPNTDLELLLEYLDPAQRENASRAELLKIHRPAIDWMIPREVFLLLEEKWGPHSVDLFAKDQSSSQLQDFIPELDDAFSLRWDHWENLYAAPHGVSFSRRWHIGETMAGGVRSPS